MSAACRGGSVNVLTTAEEFVNGLPDAPADGHEPLVDVTLITACFKARYHQDLITSVFAELYKAAGKEERESFDYHVRVRKGAFEITARGKVIGEFIENKGAAYLLWIRSVDDLMALDRLSDCVLKED